jgi:hypothetical protein
MMARMTIRETRLEAHGDVHGIERPHHRLAQPVGADQGGDHHHRQTEHDALDDACHDGRQRVRQLDFEKQLAPSSAECLAHVAARPSQRR